MLGTDILLPLGIFIVQYLSHRDNWSNWWWIIIQRNNWSNWSRIIIQRREEAAVSEWLDSGLPFHVMRWERLKYFEAWIGIFLKYGYWYCRDNPYHNTAILGGMWGARMDTGMRNTLDASFRQLFNNVRTKNLLWKCEFSKGMTY